ncbi:hypothetical protein [Streptomyces sp. 840.1]|uniref:hypothetical protein n=1 Tax=Streptomyces sp. 840.1 TaxID=2485152 RepID=UPI0021A4B292|nr:hypothetical protein [Streptomyces sp. 840.1]
MVGVAIGIVGGVICVSWIVTLFVRDHRIAVHGRDVRALVEDVGVIARNDSDSVTIRYTLSWSENGGPKRVTGTETVPVRREAEVLAGREVNIRYLDDENLRFVFDR